MQQFKRDNHYIPELYLKQWSNDGNSIYTFRILVSTDKVKKWELKSIGKIAYYTDLYTRYCTDGDTDEIENWLSDEFESPARDSIKKAISGSCLKPSDWKILIKFVAAQYVRTPARMQEWFTRWETQMPTTISTALNNATKELEKIKDTGKSTLVSYDPDPISSILNSKVKIDSLGNGTSRILLETDINRSMWLWAVKYTLTDLIKILHSNKWQIVKSHPDISWITSDDPVICLNYYGYKNYNFNGGWGQKGTEIICPISPKHILYTQVGNRKKIEPILSKELSANFQKLFAEHAFRFIFAHEPIQSIDSLRKRHVSIELFNNEQNAWNQWNEKQKASESSFVKRDIK